VANTGHQTPVGSILTACSTETAAVKCASIQKIEVHVSLFQNLILAGAMMAVSSKAVVDILSGAAAW